MHRASADSPKSVRRARQAERAIQSQRKYDQFHAALHTRSLQDRANSLTWSIDAKPSSFSHTILSEKSDSTFHNKQRNP